MISASSSSCEFGDYWQYNYTDYQDNNCQCYWKNPFHSSFRQPMVYYTQIPFTRAQRSTFNRKGNPNCFVRAFRWYTEERVEDPRTQSSKHNPDIVGFATWLDTKYEEFVQEKHTEHTDDNLSLKNTSVFETENIQQHEVCKKHIVKKFARLKSPWRKRKSNEDTGDVKYILHPKDLTRPPSECFYVSQTSYNRSDPIVYMGLPEAGKLIIKSHSCTGVCDKSYNVNDFLQITQGGTVKEIGLLNKKTNSYEMVTKSNVSSKSLVTDLTKDVSCQCSETIINKIDKQTQYDNLRERFTMISSHEEIVSKRPAVVPQSSCSKNCCGIQTQTESLAKVPTKTPVKGIVQEFENGHNVSCQCYDEISKSSFQNEVEHNIRTFNKNSEKLSDKQSSPDFRVFQRTDSLILKQFAALRKTTGSFTILVNDAAQTSDSSIKLEQDDGHNYPLFMRVIYADKLDKKIRN